jgi:metal-responsive CopG/Arc/MetJ family transcriptional regulator
MATKTIRTTFAVPADLLEAADRMVRRGAARSRNELVTSALRRELEARHREAVDASIGDMARDTEYLKDVEQIMAEFAVADVESLSPRGPCQ